MKSQVIFENLIILALVAIIAIGIYKLVHKWTSPQPPKTQPKAHKIIDAPSKELCSFMMKQCQGRFSE